MAWLESNMNNLSGPRVRVTSGSPWLISLLMILVTACASVKEQPPLDLPDWTLEFERPIEFQLLVNDSLLVVGTTRHLYGLDPASGTTLWRQRNVAVSSTDLTTLGERPFLLVNDALGGAFDDRDTNILALDHGSGNIVWESRMLQGKIMQGTLDEEGEVLYFATLERAHGDDRGFLSGTFGRKGIGSGYEQVPILHALDVVSGQLLWTQPFEREVALRPSYGKLLDDQADWEHTRPFDLGLYHPPQLIGNLVCVTYQGIHCYNSSTGNLEWKSRYKVLVNDLALSYANPLLDGSTLITSGNRRLRAYDVTNGKLLWKSEKLDIVSELFVADGVIYGQMGGQFLDIDSEKWKSKGDFGVVALHQQSGKTLWKFDDADDSTTNLLIYQDRIWLGDKKQLIALDRASGEVVFTQPHNFEEAPAFAALNELDQVVLVGEGEAAAFTPDLAEPIWHVIHPPVRPGAWSRFSSALMRASGNVLKFSSFVLSHGVGLLPSLVLPIGNVDFKLVNTKKIVSTSLGRSGRRLTYDSGVYEGGVGNSNLSGNYQYFVTQPKGRDSTALAVVNLTTGATERMIKMDADRPNLVINESRGNLYEAAENRLAALPLGTSDQLAYYRKRPVPESVPDRYAAAQP